MSALFYIAVLNVNFLRLAILPRLKLRAHFLHLKPLKRRVWRYKTAGAFYHSKMVAKSKKFCVFLVKGGRLCLYYYCKTKSEIELMFNDEENIKKRRFPRRRILKKTFPRRRTLKRSFPKRRTLKRNFPRPKARKKNLLSLKKLRHLPKITSVSGIRFQPNTITTASAPPQRPRRPMKTARQRQYSNFCPLQTLSVMRLIRQKMRPQRPA